MNYELSIGYTVAAPSNLKYAHSMNQQKQSKVLKVAVLCGGPSFERGISLNSARSVLDHLSAPDVTVIPIYFDTKKQAWKIEPAQLYSNTPSDFDFKLSHSSQRLSDEQLQAELQAVDMVFPAIHGQFGEDGELQAYLESVDVPFIGSGSRACLQAFDKHNARQFLDQHGYLSVPSILLEQGSESNGAHAADFFAEHDLSRAIVKPTLAGSSIGVFSVDSVKGALAAMQQIYDQGIDTRVIVEPFIHGVEFTMMILSSPEGEPVALVPTEVEIDYDEHQVFDYRKKYLPTRQVTWHSPPRFSDDIIRQIQRKGEQLFRHFTMRDAARFDGWLTEDGEILFSDFNPICGMEQNSFLFLQCAQLGMSHADTLRYILGLGCRRSGLSLSDSQPIKKQADAESVNVLFGGDNAERQVSVMTGTNVWLKLHRSERFIPKPYLLESEEIVWEVPYAQALHHTVEEIADACRRSAEIEPRLAQFRSEILAKLRIPNQLRTETHFVPRKLTLEQFIAESKLVFIGLHGGMGEDGRFQQRLEATGVSYTGSQPIASLLMMDKYATAEAIKAAAIPGVEVAHKVKQSLDSLTGLTQHAATMLWAELTDELRSHSLIVKPIGDGCSAGIVRLHSSKDLLRYVEASLAGVERLAPHTIYRQSNIVEMPTETPKALLFEPFIETDDVFIAEGEIFWKRQTDFIEMTVGVVGPTEALHPLSPSVTIASGEVLTVEEKFQGGTGVNLTPPPTEFVTSDITERVKDSIAKVADCLGVNGYARIDCFVNRITGEIIVIEANSLPALTPSTVLFHQALSEQPPIFPTQLLEKILDYRIRPRNN